MFKSTHPSESYSLWECFIIIEMFELRQVNRHLKAYHVQIQRPIRLCIIVNNLQMDRVHIHLRA